MKIWLDAQLSPAVARWLEATFAVEALAIQEDSVLVSAEDAEIFAAAREAKATMMTKDRDFVDLLARFGPPPQVLWISCGNTSNRAMKHILASAFPPAMELIQSGEPLVEISDVR